MVKPQEAQFCDSNGISTGKHVINERNQVRGWSGNSEANGHRSLIFAQRLTSSCTMRRSRYDAFGIAVTNPKKIV
ncbi:MAG: hypothetical protein DMG97_13860 [Acidobacteria bacterium]|nr:MAG: hypothetical protein DMG97_13860 [Acidobacteriota bacterium]PYX50440.1 MAG: hypothetical protein DMG76_34605 [Acidobacteriota bacterium]